MDLNVEFAQVRKNTAEESRDKDLDGYLADTIGAWRGIANSSLARIKDGWSKLSDLPPLNVKVHVIHMGVRSNQIKKSMWSERTKMTHECLVGYATNTRV